MRPCISTLILALLIFPGYLFSQSGWSDPYLVSDTLTDNRNAVVEELDFYDGYDFYVFWEKTVDDSTTAIYARKIYDLDEPVEVLRTQGTRYTNPQVIPGYPSPDISFVLFYNSDENGGLDIYYRYYESGSFTGPGVLSTAEGDDISLSVNDYRFLTWQRNDSILQTRLLLNNLLDTTYVIDQGGCSNPVMMQGEWSDDRTVAWQKVINDSSHIFFREFNYSSTQWFDPVQVTSSGHNTCLRFTNSLYGMNPIILTFDRLDQQGHTINVYDIYEGLLYEFDFHQDEPTMPSMFTYFILVSDWLDGAYMSFVGTEEDTFNLMVNTNGWFEPNLNDFIVLAGDTLHKFNPCLFQGDIYGLCYHDIINVWETEKNGMRQLWASVFPLCLWGNIGEGNATAGELEVSPNPATDRINISCHLPPSVPVRIQVYSSSGRLIEEVVCRSGAAGELEYSLSLNKNRYKPGLHLVKVISEGATVTGKVMISG